MKYLEIRFIQIRLLTRRTLIIFCTWHATTMIICRAHLHRAYFLIFWIVLQFVKLVLIRILVMLAIRWVNKQLIMNWLRGMLKQLHMLFIYHLYLIKCVLK